ncbi:MAG: zinc ribbon domain-containing protein [Cyanobacteria bacterium RUI128]|nr:zinc ribbon domain-containing protein [Cyanobacteria bacterium RUI128]
MECPKCGNEVKDSDKKCPYCNKVLQLECPVCHKFNRGTVCEECGNVIIVKCHQCGTPGPNSGKCRKCGFSTAKSVIMNEAETEEYACLAITFPNLEDLRPALKNKQIFNKFKKKLKQALFGYAKSQDNRAQAFGETYVIKYYKEFSFTSSVKKAVKSAIELLNKIGGISHKLKKGKNVRLHCKMTILKKTFETDNNEFNTGLNIKLIKDNTEEKYTDGLQLITDQYINNIISREYTLEMIYSSQVGDELLMFYEFPLEDQIIPIVEEEQVSDKSILKGPRDLPKLKIYDDDDKLHEILYGNKAIDISTEGQFLSVPAHNIFNVLNELFNSNAFVALKTTERRDLPTADILNFLKTKYQNVWHVVCKENFKYQPYTFFRDLLANILNIDLNHENAAQKISAGIGQFDTNNMFSNLLNNKPSETDPDTAFVNYVNAFREFLSKQKNAVIFIENLDLIDETSLRILNDYISSLVNVGDLSLSFAVTVRSEYSVYKSIPKLLHSPFYKEINVTKGDYAEFLASIPDDISEVKESFYISKLEERCAGSLIYFKNEFQYLKDTNVFITFENKLMINAEKTIVFPGTVQELFTRRFTSLPENEGLVVAYTMLLGGSANVARIQKLMPDAENLEEAIQNVINKSLVNYHDEILTIENYRIFYPAFLKAVPLDVKQTLATNIMTILGYTSYELYNIMGQDVEKLARIHDLAINCLHFGDFNSYLNCAKVYFALIDELKIKEGEAIDNKNELYSILVNHLNRYPSTKVYGISKAILANATANKDDETIVNVSHLVLDSAMNGGDFVLAQQCIQNILTRILNPKLIIEGEDYTPQFVIYSCIQAKIEFNLAQYDHCIAVCDKILSTLTPEFTEKLSGSGVDKSQFMSYVMDILVYSALARIIIADDSLEEFFEKVKEVGGTILSEAFLLLLKKLYHNEEFDNNAGISNDVISNFISELIQAFKNFSSGYNEFAQNIYKAKLAVQNSKLMLFSLLCDLLIGYSYQKINVENQVSWKKCETIYEDVYKTAQLSGMNDLVLWTNWFKITLLKDKEMYEDAYELIMTLSNSMKRQRIKDRLLMILTYILMLNIAVKIESKKTDIPIIVYRLTYEAERFNLENFYKLVDEQNYLDPEYMQQFKDAIAAEQAALEAEREAEEQAKREAEEQAKNEAAAQAEDNAG